MLLASLYTTAIAQDCPPQNVGKTTSEYEALIEAYCEDGNGISTNPANLLNSACPDLKNDFEWRIKQAPSTVSVNPEFYIVYNESGNPLGVRNPFNDPGNHEYSHIVDNHNSNYYPEDGWELLKVDFGALSNFNTGWDVTPQNHPGLNPNLGGKKLPYMILYNKYSGTFRFFGSLLGQNDDHETVRIELRISKRSPNYPGQNTYQDHLKATNLLSIQGDAVQPLDQETDENVLVVFAKATNNASQFFWFDIPVAYDPCLCNIRSQLDITFSFVSTASISLNGTIDGALKTKHKVDAPGTTGDKVAATVIAAGVSTALAVKTGGAVINFQAYSDLVKLLKDIPGLSSAQKDDLDELSNYVDCGLKFAKVIKNDFKDVSASGSLTAAQKKAKYKAANNILDANTTFLSSIANGCEKKDNGATTINAITNLSGTWTETIISGNTEILMAVPGSNWTDFEMDRVAYTLNGKTVPAYPTYNERLGTFALLETPKINLYRRHVRHDPDEPIYNSIGQLLDIIPGERINMYRLAQNSSIKYAFNPKMNVNEAETEIQFRYVVKQKLKVIEDTVQFRNHVYQNHNLVHVDNSSLYPLSSPFMPIEYYQDFNPFVFVLNENQDHHHPTLARDSIFIQFKISMVSNDIGREGPNSSVLFFTYPVDISFEEMDDLPVPNPFPSTQSEIEAWQNAVALRNVEIWNTFYANRAGIVNGGKGFNSDVTWSENTVLAYDGIVEISAKLASTAGKKVTIYSTMGFELLPGAEISPNIELIIGYPFESNPVAQQSYQQVSSFCSDNNKYKAQEFATEALAEERKTYEERARMRQIETMKYARTLKFAVKPNPTRNVTVLSWEGDEVPQHLKLLNGTGQLLFETPLSGDALKYDLDMSLFANGVYYVILTTPSGKQGQQKLIKL